MKPAPDFSVIIVSWNVAELLRDCLRSLYDVAAADGLSVEVIVVDNASKDDTAAMVRSAYPAAALVVNPDNRGFARASNQGLAMARGELALALNPDTVVQPGALKELKETFRRHPSAALTGPRILLSDGTIQPTAARRLPVLASVLWLDSLKLYRLPAVGAWLQRRLKYPYDYDREQAVEAISGAAMAMRRELVGSWGGFGEDFLHTGEDVDLCARARRNGQAVWYAPRAAVVHLSGQSSRQTPVRAAVNGRLSDHIYYRRNRGAAAAALYRMILLTVQVPMLVGAGLVKRVLGRETREQLKVRFQIAAGIIRWRQVQREQG